MRVAVPRLPSLLALVLLAVPGPSLAAGSAMELVFDPGVSVQARANFQRAADAVDGLLARYQIVLSSPVTVAVTDNDPESYIRAIMAHCGVSRAEAEKKAKTGTVWGISPSKRSAVVLRNVPTRQMTGPGQSVAVDNPEEGFRTLPHELFHQVKSQSSSTRTVNWLAEGPPEFFKYLALEAAGIRSLGESVRLSEQAVRKAGKLPGVGELASEDYRLWESLAQARFPVYPMAGLMTVRLVGDGGLEKVLRFYQLLHDGNDVDTAFTAAFGVTTADFLAAMDGYFKGLTAGQGQGAAPRTSL
jgi:hypothetical protein